MISVLSVIAPSANKVLWHGALNGGFNIAATDYFQGRNLSLSWNRDLKISDYCVLIPLFQHTLGSSAKQPCNLAGK